MMNFVKILSIVISLNASTPDTIFRVCSVADTIYVTSNDIVQIDTYGLFQLTYHLSKEMCNSLHSLNTHWMMFYQNTMKQILKKVF